MCTFQTMNIMNSLVTDKHYRAVTTANMYVNVFPTNHFDVVIVTLGRLAVKCKLAQSWLNVKNVAMVTPVTDGRTDRNAYAIAHVGETDLIG